MQKEPGNGGSVYDQSLAHACHVWKVGFLDLQMFFWLVTKLCFGLQEGGHIFFPTNII